MRKGVLVRLSKVVITLSLVSFVPVTYFEYKNLATDYRLIPDLPKSYLSDPLVKASFPNRAFAAYPFDKGNKPDILSHYDVTLPIDRIDGSSPILYIPNSYMIKYYPYTLRASDHTEPVDQDINALSANLNKERMAMSEKIKKLVVDLDYYESQFLTDAIASAVIICFLIPLSLLAIVFTVSFVIRYILYGRSKEVAS